MLALASRNLPILAEIPKYLQDTTNYFQISDTSRKLQWLTISFNIVLGYVGSPFTRSTVSVWAMSTVFFSLKGGGCNSCQDVFRGIYLVTNRQVFFSENGKKKKG